VNTNFAGLSVPHLLDKYMRLEWSGAQIIETVMGGYGIKISVEIESSRTLMVLFCSAS